MPDPGTLWGGPGWQYGGMAERGEFGSDLDEIERRCEAATPGPWRSFVEGRDHHSGDDFIRTAGLDDGSPDMYVSLSTADGTQPAGPADLDFIAHARQDLPNLVAALRDRGHQQPMVERPEGEVSERGLVDAHVDYGNISGYFVRLDVEIPAQGLWHRQGRSPVAGYLMLTADEAEDLGRLLVERASAVRQASG